MQKNSSFKWPGVSVVFTASLLFVALLISVNITSPTLAQGDEPTPTPNDPLWRAFNAARDAVEEERTVDLSLVQRYTIEQE